MAEYILDVVSQTSKLDWAFPFQRTGQFPIDRSALFSSLTDAQNYAKGDASDERELGGTSYVGQIISVYDAGVEASEGVEAVPASVNAYIITPSRSLMKLAATTASGDVVTDVAALQGQVAGILGDLEELERVLAGKAVASEVEAALALKANSADVEAALAQKANAADIETAVAPKADKSYVDEELAKKAVASDVNTELAKKANASEMTEALALKANAADVYGKSETYTKTEVETYVNNQIGSAGHLKREIVKALPEVETANADTIYMVKKSGGLVDRDHYEEYMIINDAWEMIGDTFVDLTNYATKNDVAGEVEALEGKIDLKAAQSDLELANQEIAKKADAETVNTELAKKADAETVNGALDLKADKTQVATDIENAIAPLAVKTEVEEALALKATVESVNGLAQDLADHEAEASEAMALKADKSYVDEELAKKADSATTLEGYGIADAYTKDEIDAALLLKASQQDHNELVDEVGKKANAADVFAKGETYSRQEIADLIADITGGESAADVLAALNTYKGENDKRVGDVEDRVKALEELEADDNVIEAIKLAGASAALEISEKTVTIPAATAQAYGLVKLSTEIGVNEAGALEVKNLNVNKLIQTTDEWLILNGGTAAI